MTQRFWLTSDTHFDLSNADHIERVVSRWNQQVEELDIVWHLGDVAVNVSSLAPLARLKGRKYLLLGNRDRFPIENYLQYFLDASGYIIYRDLAFCHIPVHEQSLRDINCVFHAWAPPHDHVQRKDSMDPRYFCVSQHLHQGGLIEWSDARDRAMARGAKLNNPDIVPTWN